ncbi:hypothetical protein F4604DRAFT_1786358 [Suillus subluteus]|nr:hypothetical protein F4604DRAFT_1786358 [Suillus subluteus]
MSNLQTPDARTALMQSVILSRHLQASPARISPSSPLRRPSRSFNVQDFAGNRKQAASPSKRKAREDNIALAIRGRTIYNSRLPHTTPLELVHYRKRKRQSLDILQRMEAEEEHREKDQGFLVEARGGSPSYQAEDKSLWMGVSESDADYHMPRGSEQGTPSSDMEHSPSRWNAPKFNSGEGDWETMFDMYIKEQECMEAMML